MDQTVATSIPLLRKWLIANLLSTEALARIYTDVGDNLWIGGPKCNGGKGLSDLHTP